MISMKYRPISNHSGQWQWWDYATKTWQPEKPQDTLHRLIRERAALDVRIDNLFQLCWPGEPLLPR